MTVPSITIDPIEKEIFSTFKPIEIRRYKTLKNSLTEWKYLFADKMVLDYGSGSGLSTIALIYNGAGYVIGIDPDEERVKIGNVLLQRTGLSSRTNLSHVRDTLTLPFDNNSFQFVLANGVLEHIPIPRIKYLSEIWRIVTPGGFLFINETPNKYYPKDMHTSNLWFNHWLPKDMGYKRAISRKLFKGSRKEWESSGWRGLGYGEIVTALQYYKLIPERSRLRHRIFDAIGIPPSILDPYPTWIFMKYEKQV